MKQLAQNRMGAETAAQALLQESLAAGDEERTIKPPTSPAPSSTPGAAEKKRQLRPTQARQTRAREKLVTLAKNARRRAAPQSYELMRQRSPS